MRGIACPHCTFLNAASRVKCSMCLRLLRKRDTSENTTATSQTREQQKKQRTERRSATPSRSESAEKSGASSSQSERDGSEDGEDRSRASTTEPMHGTEKPVNTTALPLSSSFSSFSSAVPTLFVTASGRAVTVRRESLQKAAEKFSDTAPLSLPQPESRVATLFETASGKKMTVRTDSIEKARVTFASLEESSAEPPLPPQLKTVSTLFETAAGTAVRVSEASLRKAREKLQDVGDEDDDGDGLNEERRRASHEPPSPPPPIVDAAPALSISEVRGAAAAAASDLHNLRRPGSGLMGLSAGRRKGFVPPQQRLPTAAAAGATSATALPPSTVSTAVTLRTTHVTPLRFTPLPPPHRSSPLLPTPTLDAIMRGDIRFHAEDCGAVLCALFGVSAGQTVGMAQWHSCLLRLGASAKHCSAEWCRHAVLSSMARLACASLTLASPATTPIFTAEAVLLCVLQAYNTEMVNGERPALRKMCEGDIPAASLTVLYLSSIREERSAPHMRLVTLCDGVYHMKVTCDVPLSNLLREGVLRPGQKLALCGARLLLHGQCSPTECDTQTVLAINYNCVRAVASTVPLGVCHGEPQPLPLSLVHPLGGLVPAIEGVVARVLPAFYISQESESFASAEDGSRPARDRAIRAVRSRHAQLQVSDRLHRESEGGGGVGMEAKVLSRVTSLLVVRDGAEALVQQWDTVEERSLLADEDVGAALPTEGSWITLYAVNPAKSRTAAAPFSRAKLFFSSRKLHFVPSRKPLQQLRVVWDTAADRASTVCVGDAVDVCGLFIGHLKSRNGAFVLLLLRDGMYAVLQISVPSAGRVVSFPIPTVEKTPLLILNATFLTAEDSVAGSDCCRVFANEYTELLQRSTQHNFKVVLQQASALRDNVDAAVQKHTARRAEIFRCIEEGEPSGTVSREAPLEDHAGDAPGSAMNSSTMVAGSVSSREGRLPYYLRQGNTSSGDGGGAGRRLHGVFIPSSSFPSSSSPPTPRSVPFSMPVGRQAEATRVAPARAAGPPSRRYYGNISDLLFLCDPRLNRRPWHPLEDALREDDGTDADFTHVQLCWSLSADSSNDITGRVADRQQLHTVLEAVCPLRELCSLIADERYFDVSLRRSETVLRWRKSVKDGVWWRFLTASRLLTAATELEEKSDAYLWWLPGEWAEAAKMLREKMRTALFFVLLGGDEALRHARLISDNCDVRELPCD